MKKKNGMEEEGRYNPSLFPFAFTLLPCLQLVLASGNSTLGQVHYIYHPVILVENTRSLLKKNQVSYIFPTVHSPYKHPAMVPQSSIQPSKCNHNSRGTGKKLVLGIVEIKMPLPTQALAVLLAETSK